MELTKVIDELENNVRNPAEGLPEEVFLMISRITPLVNVDLLIKNEKQDTLLTWRDDSINGCGWHIPGGIIRFKEKASDRINVVAHSELGTKVSFHNKPLEINEIILDQNNRGHFISLLFECVIIASLDEKLKYHGGSPKAGEWAWHKTCPDNLLSVQEIYRNRI